jgi:hypothetical protein
MMIVRMGDPRNRNKGAIIINPAMKKIRESQSSCGFRRDCYRSGREAIPGVVA